MIKSRIGHISLIVAVLGFVTLELSIYFFEWEAHLWRIVATAFEAATIGALADWFAVSALFYEIPIPFVRRHTNIIVKNREKLTDGIVDMVTNKWLSPEIIREKLKGVAITDTILELLNHPENFNKLMDLIRLLLSRLILQLDHPKMGVYVQNFLKGQLQDVNLAIPLGSWLEEEVRRGNHRALVGLLAQEASKSLKDPATRNILLTKLKVALEAYQKKDWFKKSAVWLGKKTGGIDLEMLADRLLEIALILAEEFGKDPHHPLRQKLDEYLLEFAVLLRQNDEEAAGYVKKLRDNLIRNEGARTLITEFLKRVKGLAEESLENLETPLMHWVGRSIRELTVSVSKDPETKEDIDSWVKSSLAEVLDKFHPEIGAMVRTSLARLDDKSMMVQIKEKVGDDLQYIRLNGAVVGGLVGLIIAILRWTWLH